ncbi:F0F1 ATP synthase subunit B [Sporolactobacillus nakayamae]|uniref:ATP synthase subunit b n=1 Tax=Sporolactobacillus nakayamae TaxID=269670 RepID=A0A1I2Q551_9BACL|nr:F0F1 ATP synthase subunit B [Sporolactobacillus nakayamae]SFG22793.1 F-type H+-transporting ATPase subunit b [Sporolactobacillus nakayamae]
MLSFSLGNIIFQLVVFILLMIFVAIVGVRPVIAIMEKRKKYINSQIDDAEKKSQNAESYLAEQKSEIERIRNEAHSILEQAKSQANAEAKAILEAAKNRSDLMIKDANEEIGLEKEKAIAAIRDEVADLSVLLASKVLEKEINPDDYSKEIDQLIKQVGNQR